MFLNIFGEWMSGQELLRAESEPVRNLVIWEEASLGVSPLCLSVQYLMFESWENRMF